MACHCPGCGHHHRTPDTRCQAITDDPDGGVRRCNCPNTHTNTTGKDQPA